MFHLFISNVLKHVGFLMRGQFWLSVSLPVYLQAVKPIPLTEWKPSLASAQVLLKPTTSSQPQQPKNHSMVFGACLLEYSR